MLKHQLFGRCLGNLGIGIDTAVASAEEVQNAIENQKDKREWQVDNDTPLISTEQVKILEKTIVLSILNMQTVALKHRRKMLFRIITNI